MIHVLIDLELDKDSGLTVEDVRRHFKLFYEESGLEIDDERGSAKEVDVAGVTVTEG